MAIRITKRQRDKQGNIWLRDNYGGWTNEFGVRFTKTEHRRFGYAIRKANKKIAEYQAKYPTDRVSKSTDVGSRFRKDDLSRFRRKSSYKNYLAVTMRIISGEQLGKRLPTNYKNNMLKALSSPEMSRLANNSGFARTLLSVKDKLKRLSNEALIKLGRDAMTPDINSYYVVIGDVQKNNLERLEQILDDLLEQEG